MSGGQFFATFFGMGFVLLGGACSATSQSDFDGKYPRTSQWCNQFEAELKSRISRRSAIGPSDPSVGPTDAPMSQAR